MNEKILYIGYNIQLVKTMLNFPAPVSIASNHSISHLTSVDDIPAVLEGGGYTHLICELPISNTLAASIACDFPFLITAYIHPPKPPKELDLASVIGNEVSHEVKATLEHLSIPICFKNKNHEYIACNSYFSELFGMMPAQIVGKKATDLFPAQLAMERERVEQEAATENKVRFYEYKFNNPAGEARNMVIRKEFVDNGNTQIGILFDVTEINQAREALEKEHLMQRAASDMSQNIIFFKDLEGKYLGCNKEFEKLVGRSEQEILGKKDDQLFELKRALKCQEHDRYVLTNNKIYTSEEYRIDQNGDHHFIKVKKMPVTNKQGEVQGLIGVAKDVTAYNELQKHLKISNTVFEYSKETIFVTDDQGFIISVNKAACVESGFSQQELLTLNMDVFKSNQEKNIKAALQEKKYWRGVLSYQGKNKQRAFAWLEVYVIEHAQKGTFNRIYTFTKLEQNKEVDEKIKYLATYDPLTGLFNRVALLNRLDDAMTRAQHKETEMAVILIAINDFELISDQHGQNVRDDVLKEVAKRLKSCVFEKDTVSRFGEYEFAIIFDELANEQDGAVVARNIAAQFDIDFAVAKTQLRLSAAIGIALSPDDGADSESLIESAEQAMLRAKHDKSSPYHFYTNELTRYCNEQFQLEDELKQALQENQFELYYLPQYDINKRQVVAIEISLHWHHPQLGLLPPEEFMSLAENCGLLVPIGLRVIRKAAMQAVSWQKLGINFGRIVVHLSAVQLSKNSFIADLQTILLETKCAQKWLEFAVDERVFSDDSQHVHENLLNISKLGIELTVDNFAEDRAILNLLEQLKIKKIKLSKNFTEGRYCNCVSEGMRQSMSGFGAALGLDVVADSLDEHSLNCQVPNRGWSKNKAVKASEAAFYLHCNKRIAIYS